MEECLKLLSEVNVISIFVRMVLAMILCGAIGIERGIKNRPAGFMTYLLVGCGSTLIMITNQYIAEKYPGVDPARMAAQVVSGTGFLGAGTIITTSKKEVRGLTTAAGLWQQQRWDWQSESVFILVLLSEPYSSCCLYYG